MAMSPHGLKLTVLKIIFLLSLLQDRKIVTVNKKQTRSISKHYLGFTLRSTNQKSTDEQDEVPQENDEHYRIITTSSQGKKLPSVPIHSPFHVSRNQQISGHQTHSKLRNAGMHIEV